VRDAVNTYRQRTLIGLSLLAGLLLVVAYRVHFRAKWAVARYQRQIAAAGETLDVKKLYPPAVSPESNGAPVLLQAMPGLSWSQSLLNTNAPPSMQMEAPGKALVAWAQLDVRAGGTNTWDEVTRAVAAYSDPLDLVRDAAQLPKLDFQLDYVVGFNLLLPHLAPLKHAVQLLTTDTLCDLHRGDTAAATTNIHAMLMLVKAVADERLVISQLVRLAMAAIAMGATWELLQAPNVTEDQLAAVQRDWAEVRFIQPTRETLLMERALGVMMMQRMRNSGTQFRQAVSAGSSGGPSSTSFGFGTIGDMILRESILGAQRASWRLCTSYPDQLRALKAYEVLLQGCRSVQAGEPFAGALSQQKARLAELGLPASTDDSGRHVPWNSDLRSFFSDSVISLSRVLNRVLTAEVSRELTTTALVLKRYQLRHGQYPRELSALVPEFLAAAPRDPADGQPMRYRLKPDGTFLLYSVGEDGVDNGGDASPTGSSDTLSWQRGRDLVWPGPATAEEVRAYHEKQARRHGK
jgi:hypothetical protein